MLLTIQELVVDSVATSPFPCRYATSAENTTLDFHQLSDQMARHKQEKRLMSTQQQRILLKLQIIRAFQRTLEIEDEENREGTEEVNNPNLL